MLRETAEPEITRIAEALALSSGGSDYNPTFVARDLGFPDHTAIQALVRPVLARYAATVLVHALNGETAHLFAGRYPRSPVTRRIVTLEAMLADTAEALESNASLLESGAKIWVVADALRAQAEALRTILAKGTSDA